MYMVILLYVRFARDAWRVSFDRPLTYQFSYFHKSINSDGIRDVSSL